MAKMSKKVLKTGKMTPVRGGKGHMFTEREAGPQKPGQSASEGQSGPETQWAKGGTTKMFGKQSANPAKPC